MENESELDEYSTEYEVSSDEDEIDRLLEDLTFSEEDTDSLICLETENNTQYVSKDGSQIWYSNPLPTAGRRSAENIMRHRQGVTSYALHRVDGIEDTLALFLRPTIIQEIIDMTNKEGCRILGTNWNNVTVVEFRRFVGVLYLIGVYRGKNEPVSDFTGKSFSFLTYNKYKKFFLVGRSITCDNFFTSYQLARNLLERKITMIGTMRHNKKEIPLCFTGIIARKVL